MSDHEHTPQDRGDHRDAAEQGGIDADVARGIREAAAAYRELVQETSIEKTYWYWSIKGRRYFEVRGDTALMMLVLDELDPDVVQIEIEAPAAVDTAGGEPTGVRFDASVTYRKGRKVLKEAKRSSSLSGEDQRTRFQVEAQRNVAARRGCEYLLVTDDQLRPHGNRFWSSLAMLGWFNRVRDVISSNEDRAIDAFLEGKSGAKLEDFLALPETDPALVLGVIARRVAFGRLSVSLNRPLTRKSFFSLPTEQETPQQDDSAVTADAAATGTQPMRLPPRGDFGDIPAQMLDISSWPGVDTSFVRDQKAYESRRDAVLMFYDGYSAKDIEDRTGHSDEAVLNFIKRCAKKRFDGLPKGFPALNKYGYLRDYVRKASSDGHRLGDTAGLSGEFNRLLAMHPDLIDLLSDQTLEREKSKHGKRLKWSDIRDAFIKKCYEKISDPEIPEEKRLKKSDYPFKTKKLAYYSVIDFCKELRKGNASRYVAKRFGRNAARRARLGDGGRPLFTPTAPYQAAAADFYKVDVETKANQQLPDGSEVNVLLPRWFIGSIVCMQGGFPIADSVSLELQQTTEDVLALGEALTSTPAPSAELADSYAVARDGKWLPGQLVPALAHNGVDLLYLDRAWSNQSHQSLAKLSQTCGAVIGFCAPAAWEQKAPVERHFADVVSGLHTVPSSVGSGPKDFRRDGAADMAIRYEIGVDSTVLRIRAEVRRILNHKGAGSFGIGHVERLAQMCLNHESQWLPRPIPRVRQIDNPLSWVDRDAEVVAGTEANFRRPHVRPLGIRFTGESVSKREDLIGRAVIVQIKRDDFTNARVVVAGTGEVVGQVQPERRYNVEGMTYRMVRLILAGQSVVDLDAALTNPVLDFAIRNQKALAARRKKRRKVEPGEEQVRGHTEGLRLEQMRGAKVQPEDTAPQDKSARRQVGLPGEIPNKFSFGSFSRRSSR